MLLFPRTLFPVNRFHQAVGTGDMSDQSTAPVLVLSLAHEWPMRGRQRRRAARLNGGSAERQTYAVFGEDL